MAAGIYRLTFSSGKFYIGKSLDLEARWRQHFNKFALGKAARPMQLEYDRCGLPETEVIFYCHQDHIDILEELLIEQFKCGDMLNSTYPKCSLTDRVALLINKSHDLLKQSTFEHLEMIHGSQDLVDGAELAKEIAERALETYKSRGYIIDDDYKDMVALANKFKNKYFAHKTELQRLQKLSWYDRLFNYSVYV